MNLAEIQSALAYGRERGTSAELFPEGADPAVWKRVREDAYYRRVREELDAAAEQYRSRPILDLPYSLYQIFDTTGSRKEYEAAYYEHRGRMNAFAARVLLYGEKEDVEALEDSLWAICNEYTWCLPAHLNGKSLNVPDVPHVPDGRGNISIASRDQRRVVDLFAAETGFAFAEILHLLGDRLSPLVAYRMKEAVAERILKPLQSIGPLFVWDTATNNWSAVCAGSVGATALYLIQDDSALTPILHRLLGALEAFLDGYAEDGGCTEGIGYWEYGFGFYVCFAELLRRRTGGKIDLLQGEKLKKIALFPQRCYLAEDKVASFSDGFVTFRHHSGLFCCLQSRFEEVEVRAPAFECGLFADHCFRWCHFIRDFVWNTEGRRAVTENATYFLKDAQWMCARRKTGRTAVGFAAKGGSNGEPHNHNDLGSFVFNVNGDMLLTDLGSGEYTSEYFGPRRYTLIGTGSQGHSVPIVEGHFQSAGAEFRARVLEASEEETTLKLDLTQAYEAPNLKSLVRSYSLQERNGIGLVLTDMFTFREPPTDVMERFVTQFRPEIAGEGEVKIAGPKGSASILFDASAGSCQIGSEVFVNHSGQSEPVYTIDFVLKAYGPAVQAGFTVVADIVPT